MKINVPKEVQEIISVLQEHGHDAYAVGGCVRDSLLGRAPADWDITTSAKPMEVKRLFRRTVDTGIQHGTVTVMFGKEGFEVTTYRIDGEYEDGRHPKEVTFTGEVREDLRRRDFTINAMAYNDKEGLLDLFGGIDDLNKKVIRCVGNPEERFTEDALRIMRAVRFAGQLGFSIEEKTKQAAGMSTAADVLEKENQLLSARSSLSSLEESLNSTYSSLCLMVGRDTDSGLVICEIPAADLAKADSMDLEADTKKAIGNNSSLISSRGTKATSTAAKNNRNATVEEGEQNLTIQMNQLYENVLLKKSELQAAQTAFRKAEGQKKNADIKYSAGLLSQEEYLTEEMNYISQTASYKAADLAFTQAADTYGWAVMGITQ